MAALTDLRVAELLAALSLETDLAMGLPAEHAMRACLVATSLARDMGIDEAEVAAIYYTTLLRYVGCTAFSHEEALLLGGDDVAVRRAGASVDFTNPREILPVILGLGKGAPPLRRIRTVTRAMAHGLSLDPPLKTANCEVAATTARRLGLDEAVDSALYQIFERWDGKGVPKGLAGERVAIPSRYANVAHLAVMFDRVGGTDAALSMVLRRSGGWLDPGIAEAFARRGADILRVIEEGDVWVRVLDSEPEPQARAPDRRVDEVARAFADVVDLKSPYLHSHSAGVATLAEGAAQLLGLAEVDVVAIRRSALFHDLGRVGVPTAIWEKPGPLAQAEWEAVRLHPYHTERILVRSLALAPLAPIAGMHHERVDGSGYHRGAPAALLTTHARILAAADVYHALTERRPHRPAFSPDDAGTEFEREVTAGRLDRDTASAVLEAAGETRTMARAAWPAGLTDREVEVLRLLAEGRSKREVAKVLFISTSTAHTHVVHIYEKIGLATRAGAALFAMEHGLLKPEPSSTRNRSNDR